ncbi:MAG: SDR family oxidoreductase [Acidobacteria bacterium]|nr:SDR family oxidoreductase [Acidobacteriota bacterium]
MSRQPAETGSTDIAIIGMSGRFPGARNIAEFWENIRDGVESRTEFTDDDMVSEGISLKLRHPRHVRAGFVLDDLDAFDSAFFGINPREAETIDPQHRIFLECAWEALEDAGCDAERFPGVIGLIAGSSWCNYLLNNVLRSAKLLKSMGVRQLIFGSVPDYMVTRAAYRLNLNGPAYFIQSACSTSLTAVHLARQTLLSRECDVVLAGGVAVKVPHRVGYVYEEGGMEAPDGRVRAFDANARGTVFSSGVGVVVLKRLEDARRDGDYVYAVIKSSASNNDGAHKVGFTAPSVAGQAEVIARALDEARIPADEIDYVEAHGTGTELGDPIELAALTRAFGARTARRGYCGIGSVKPNVGHLDAAAGVSSLIKTVLALQHRQLPPTINFERLNPKIAIEDTPFYINTVLREWTRANGRPRRAGVSSFGFGGTNAHLVIEEAPAPPSSGPVRPHQLLVLSARTPAALEAASRRLAAHLSRETRIAPADVAFGLQLGRKQFAHRRAIVCRTCEEAVEALHGGPSRWISTGQADLRDGRVVFLFPGQGSQYVDMARGLYDTEPVFRAAVDECASALHEPLGFDLRSVLYPDPDGRAAATGRLTRTVVTQAAVFTVELALARLWMDWGIRPAAMVGHSIGELVAACVSGVMSLPDALRLVAARGRLMESMPEGAMLAVPLGADRARELLRDGLWLAASNSPSLSVIAGRHDAVDDLERRLIEIGVEGRRLRTSHAFHSGMMDAAVERFVEIVRAVDLRAPAIPYLSNVTGDWATEALVTDPAYWGRHIRETVRFADAVSVLSRDRGTAFVEVGPGNTLSTFVRQQSRSQDDHLIVASLRHPQEDAADTAVVLGALGRLWTFGAAIDWDRFSAAEERRRVPLPTYPFERTRHWIEPDKVNLAAARRAGSVGQQDDLADWFFVPSWKRTTRPRQAREEGSGGWLVFADRGGVGDAMAARLRAEGRTVWTVRAADGFAHAGSDYAIDAAAAADYVRLIRELHRQSPRPATIVHLWGVDGTPADAAPALQARGFYSLLFLLQALGEVGMSSKLQLGVVTAGLQDVTGRERLVPEKATALGPARVAPLELQNISSRAIDLQFDDLADPARLGADLVQELSAASTDATIAYRQGRRWVQTYEPIRLGAAGPDGAVKLRDGGTYLITGGFGGIGLVLAGHLAGAVRCNLVLTGRRGLPPRDTWDAHLARRGSDDPTSRRIAAVRGLEAAGAQVMAGDADVADAERMRAVVDEARARFGRIDGIIHSAGVAGGGMIQLKKPEAAAAVLGPKVDGTRVLAGIFREHRLDFFVLCSSLTSILGGVGQVDYCGANAYLDAFARAHAASTGTPTIAVNWSAWREVGMAVETAMPDALESTLRQQMLAAGLTNRDGADAFARVLAAAPDAQIAVSSFDVQVLAEVMRERDATDEPQAGATPGAEAGHQRPEVATALVEPRSETERRICAIWRDMLGIAQVGVNDSFFELGGHSLLAVRTMTRMNEVLGTEVPVAKLYEGLTVAYLAQAIDGAGDGAPAHDDRELAQRRREKARRQKEHQQRRIAAARR